MILRIAWRNIWRSRSRSLVIIAAIGIGIWAALFLTAFYNGAVEQRIRSAIEMETAHLQLHHPLFREDFDLRYQIPGGDSLLTQISTWETVQAASPRILAPGMVASAAGSAGIQVLGVDPDREKRVSTLHSFVREGNYLLPDGKHEVLIGKKLARKLGVETGGKIVLTVTDLDGNISSGAFRISGIYETNNAPYDESQVFVHLAAAAELTGLGKNINEIAVLLKSDVQVEATGTRMRERWKGIKVESWQDISPEMNLLVVSFDQMILIYMGIILLALAFGIVNTMMMSVLERTREIGMLLSLGMNRLRVFGMISLETMLLVMAGCPGGILLAFITIWATRKTGINLGMFSDLFASFGYSNLVFPSLSSKQFFTMMALVVVTAFLSALFPARRALMLRPVEAIRK